MNNEQRRMNNPEQYVNKHNIIPKTTFINNNPLQTGMPLLNSALNVINKKHNEENNKNIQQDQNKPEGVSNSQKI